MKKFGVVVLVCFSVTTGCMLGLAINEAYAQTVKKKKPQIANGDESVPMPRQVGDEFVREFSVTPDVGADCNWHVFDRNTTPDIYNPTTDKASTFWSMNCGNGEGTGCIYSYVTILARGSYSLFNLPTKIIWSGTGGNAFDCGQVDANHSIFMTGIKSSDGPGVYTLIVYVYAGFYVNGSLPLSGDAFVFQVF